jgi:SAM-dependent methyltransferase
MTDTPAPDPDLPELSPNAFLKQDSSPDDYFYADPRFVTHIDGPATEAVTALYRECLPAGGAILDLMSSWVSHLPADIAYEQVIGHGMNERELAANPRFKRFFVQNLNVDPFLPLDPQSLDAAAICVSIQYLQRPVVVLRDLARVLKPGAPVAITFSNRCFPTKAVTVWQALADEEHGRLVALYLARAGFARIEERVLIAPGQKSDPLWAVIGWTAA